ncbi:MAG: sigma-54 dependent transcriptional regulator [Desulfobacteraceae bacterium]|nr:sigma-54 dependent transcriptional regulator [Desulfobacteraceae bacterium]
MAEKTRKILVADDDQSMRIALFEALTRNGHHVVLAEDGQMALELAEKEPPALVIADIKMPRLDGLELLRRLKERSPELPVIIITGYATVNSAVEALKHGASDYILKPFPVEVIEDTVAQVLDRPPAAPGEAPPLRRKADDRFAKPLIGRHQKLLQMLEKARSVASSKATVLILGESGTGKEVLARFIHQESDREGGPFVALNCAALPENLLESELFGHERGAFTGAVATKKGKFELASGGTLLLDEIGEIPLHLQAKLLRVLQEEEVDRLGGRGPVRIDVHVLATTNRDLAEMVKEGTFRQDLFYRLNVIPLRLPPLRERKDDIPLLAEFFIDKYCRLYAKPRKRLSREVQRLFLASDWPGNVREMENLLERAVLLSRGDELQPGDFWEEEEISRQNPPPALDPGAAPDSTAGGGAGSGPVPELNGTSLREMERQMIMSALRKTDDNRTHAAKMLGISVRTLRNKLQEYRSQGGLE